MALGQITSRVLLALLVATATPLLSPANPVRAEDYENLTHAFKLARPDGFTFCIDDHANDHGVIAYPGSPACSRPVVPVARFWASFNLPDEIDDTETLRNSICEDRGPISDISFGALKLWPCQTLRENGNVTEIFLGLRPAPGHDSGHWRRVGIAITAREAEFAGFRQRIKGLAATIVLVEPLE